jgi:hypothetical protein
MLTPDERTKFVAMRAQLAQLLRLLDELLFVEPDEPTLRPPPPEDVPTTPRLP